MNNKIKYLIKTERLIIRLAKPEDAKSIFSYRSDLVENKYQGWFPDSVEEVRDYIRYAKDNGYCQYMFSGCNYPCR